MKIAISRIYYCEKEAIGTTHPRISATSKSPIPIQYIDGAFPMFRKVNGSDLSTDGSNELIDSFPNAERHSFPGYITQKQDYAFRIGAKYDAILKLACDEWIEGDWERFCSNLASIIEAGSQRKIFNIKYTILSGDPRKLVAKPRLFIDPARFRMGERHYVFIYDNTKMHQYASSGIIDVDGIEIFHDNRIRPKWRDDLMTEYQLSAPTHIRDVPYDPDAPRPGQYRNSDK